MIGVDRQMLKWQHHSWWHA